MLPHKAEKQSWLEEGSPAPFLIFFTLINWLHWVQKLEKENNHMSLRPRVLLVDDDPDITLALSDYLRQEGFDVEVAETGNAALHKGKTQSFDEVLLDVGLPDRDGIEVLMELSQYKPHLPIVFLTALTSLRETVHPDKLSKAFAYLTKPYRREKVKEVLYQSIIWASEAD